MRPDPPRQQAIGAAEHRVLLVDHGWKAELGRRQHRRHRRMAAKPTTASGSSRRRRRRA